MVLSSAASHRSMEGEDVIAIGQLCVLVVQLPRVLQGTFSGATCDVSATHNECVV